MWGIQGNYVKKMETQIEGNSCTSTEVKNEADGLPCVLSIW